MSKDRMDEISAIAEQVKEARDHSRRLGLKFEANLLDMAVDALQQLTNEQISPRPESNDREPD